MSFNEWWDIERQNLECRGAKSSLLEIIFESCFKAWNAALENDKF